MNTRKLYQVDAFASELFKGNPAAVVPLDAWLDATTMLQIAAENNLSETAFFVGAEGRYHIRWFTPTDEIDLCGHATLAAAFVIFRFLERRRDALTFESRSGDLTVTRAGNILTLDFPAARGESRPPPPLLAEALGKPPAEYYAGRYHLAVFDSEKTIRELQPNLELVKKLPGVGLIVTAPGEQEDFVSRFFCPQIGIAEDPVTGAAHCYLTPYWAQRLQKNELTARQVSSREGELLCSLAGERVRISGQAKLYLEGILHLPKG
jgi:PhzF family phenazine biosynthesis protein